MEQNILKKPIITSRHCNHKSFTAPFQVKISKTTWTPWKQRLHKEEICRQTNNGFVGWPQIEPDDQEKCDKHIEHECFRIFQSCYLHLWSLYLHQIALESNNPIEVIVASWRYCFSTFFFFVFKNLIFLFCPSSLPNLLYDHSSKLFP